MTILTTSKSRFKKGFRLPRVGLCSTLFFIVLFTIPSLLLLRAPPISISSTFSPHPPPWSGDLRTATFAWNHLSFGDQKQSPVILKIAVFSRKWPVGSVPGGMERHALTLHTVLARRGHRIHIFTSPSEEQKRTAAILPASSPSSPFVHYHDGEPGQWRYNKAWEQFVEENEREAFDIVHSESVALPHWLARTLPNLAVSWHGIALETLSSVIFQDLALRRPGEPISTAFNGTVQGIIPKILNEIRFFKHYSHHVATSDSTGEMIRDVYQIPTKRVHVILNGVNEEAFSQDLRLGLEFRTKIGIPGNASLVIGVAGRLVRDKGHPILHEAFSKLITRHPNVYLVVAGSGPWENRYKELGRQVLVLGSMNPSQLRAFYNGIDVFLNPTLRPQGLDQTQLEAMMSGKSVMATRFPSIKGSLVVDDEFGFMFSPNVESLLESLEEVAKEGRRRLEERGNACRRYAASTFTATKMALAHERLFLCIKNETFCMYP